MKAFIFALFSLGLLYSQNRLNGTISLESQYVNYDEVSKFWTDSNFQYTKNQVNLDPLVDVSDVQLNLSQYSTSYLVPGFRNSLNISLFNFTPNYKASLYARIQTSEWTQPDRLKHIDRVSLNLNFGNNRIVLGDHYLNSNQLFIDQRQLRGAFAQFTILGSATESNHIRFNGFGGFIEYENKIGDPVVGRYQSYYRVSRFNRSLLGSEIVGSILDKLLTFRFSYISGSDDADGQIDTLTVDPLKNRNFGFDAKFHIFERQVYIYGRQYTSTTDTLLQTGETIGEPATAYDYGLGLTNEVFTLEMSGYRIDPNYYTFGQPYLIVDREGYKLNSQIHVNERSSVYAKIDLYSTNLDKAENVFTLKSREINVGLRLPIYEKLGININALRISDRSDQILGNYLNRVSNAYDGQFNYSIENGQFSLFGGISTTIDNGNYGFNIVDSVDIKGTNSDRFYGGISGNYTIFQKFSLNTTISYNRLIQQGVDQTDVLTIQFGGSYHWIPGKLKMTTLLSVTNSDNSINSSLFTNPSYNETSVSRFQLFSTINAFFYDYYELGFEYFLNYNMRVRLAGRIDKRDYDYLNKTAETIQSLREKAVILRNPIFYNQKESYNASIITLALTYIL